MSQKKRKINSTLLHEHLYTLFRKRCKCEYKLPTQKILEVLRATYKMPRSMNYDILEEMEEMGFIKKVNHQVSIIISNEKNNKTLKKIKSYSNKFPW